MSWQFNAILQPSETTGCRGFTDQAPTTDQRSRSVLELLGGGSGLTAKRRTGLCFYIALRTRRQRAALRWILPVSNAGQRRIVPQHLRPLGYELCTRDLHMSTRFQKRRLTWVKCLIGCVVSHRFAPVSRRIVPKLRDHCGPTPGCARRSLTPPTTGVSPCNRHRLDPQSDIG